MSEGPINHERTRRQTVVLGPENDRWGINALTKIDTPSSTLNIDEEETPRFAASWHTIFIHRKDGSVVACGRNDRGQIPPGISYCEEHDTPTSSTVGWKIKTLAAGSEHILALTDDGGKILAAGWGEHGNCGPDIDADGDVKGRWATIEFVNRNSRCSTATTITGGGDDDDVGPQDIIGLGAGCATSWILTQFV
ncbi:hypothetical protein KEM54_006440 [Ascosphaera aggregata]|nr:hypothetical protein KEM54_006440 [Ascosphaera aggregata]